MRTLAASIRRALDIPYVDEESRCWGIVIDGPFVEANLVGLAAIGEIGVDQAADLVYAAYMEKGEGPATQALLSLLGISMEDCELLLELEEALGGEFVVEHLAEGEFQFASA